MNMNLSLHETRVIGCLIEKALTTPDQYPLSINSLTNACNQKSNREPVLDLSESTVQDTVDGLVKKHLVSRIEGSRVTKYQHRFCNSQFGALQLSDKSVAILCELFLRGPQTPGELRSRCERFCKFDNVTDVEAELAKLMAREEPLVSRLAREPGKREARYAHLLSGTVELSQWSVDAETHTLEPNDRERIVALERQVSELQQSLDRLWRKYEELAG